MFYDYQDGAGWTMGGMYVAQTGMQPWFGINGNETFQNITETNFPSVGAVLEKAGYNQVFMNGASLLYAGKGNFFSQQGYKCYGNEEFDKSYNRNGWGLRDKDLFEEAKKKYIELSKKEKPFNLTLLTVDTHFPLGLPDDRMENIVKSKEKNMEYCVESSDYAIGNFIDFLKTQPNYKDLAIFILTDHRLMGNEVVTPVTKKLNKKSRDLFFLTNQENIFEYEDTERRLYFYDIPKIILNGIGIKTNAKFMVDLIPNISIDYFKNKGRQVQNLNLSLVGFNSLENGIEIEKRKNKIIFKSGNKEIDKFYLSQNDIKYYSIDENLNIKGNFFVHKNSEQYKHSLDYTNSKFILVFKTNENNELEMLISDYDKNIYYRRNYNIGKKLISVGKYSLYDSKIKISKKELKNIFKNLKLREDLIKQDNLNSYLKYLEKLKRKDIIVVISARDEAAMKYPLYKESLDALGSKLDFSNKIRWSYLGVFDTKGKKYLEEMSWERIDRKLKIDKIELRLTSAGFEKGNTSQIKIDGNDYSKKRRGLNFVILNKNTGLILDAFSVDTYADDNLKLRR